MNLEIDPSFDLPKLILSTDAIIKTAKKNNNSLKGNNHYATKFVEKHAETTLAIQNLQKIISKDDDKDAYEGLKEISDKITIYFNLDTVENDRNEISKRILFLFKTKVQNVIGKSRIHTPTNKLFPLELVKNTKGYVEKIAIQACGSYDLGYYDASAVMLRRLLETLIIECFEAHTSANKIKNTQGNFFYLEDLITTFLNEDGTLWNIGRNTKRGLPNLKKIGDQSAHSRFFIAGKSDLENLKSDIRTVIEELLNHSKLKP